MLKDEVVTAFLFLTRLNEFLSVGINQSSVGAMSPNE